MGTASDAETSDAADCIAFPEDIQGNVSISGPKTSCAESISLKRASYTNDHSLDLSSDGKTPVISGKPILATIDNLPLEILQYVLQYAMQDIESPSYYHQLLHIMLVCRRWYQAAERCSNLWTRIDVGLPWDIVLMLLLRSKDAPIYVSDYSSKAKIDLNLTILCKDLHRCVVFDVEVDTLPAQGRRWFEHAAPLLRDFTLNNISGGLDSVDFFDGCAPNLDCIELGGVTPCWTSPIFSGLKALSLTDIHGKSSPTIEQVECIVKNCPLLYKLELRDMQIEGLAIVNGSEPDVGSLEQLETLTLRGIPSLAIDELLLFLVLPDSCTIYVSLNDNQTDLWEDAITAGYTKVLQWFINADDPPESPNVQAVLSATKLTFQRIDGFAARILHLGDTDDVDNFLLWFLKGIGRSLSDKIISLRLLAPFDDAENIKEVLHRLDRLESLVMSVFLLGITVNAIMSVLGKLPPWDNGRSGWPCSHLTHLELTDCFALDERTCVEMLEARYEGSPKTEKSLQSLKITGCDISKEYFKRIQAIPSIVQLCIEGC